MQARFDPFEYEGRPPRSDSEIALSATAAAGAGLKLGDTIRVQGTQRIRSYTMVGTTTFGGAGSTGGAAFTVLTLPEVQALAGEPGKITDLDVQAQPGVTQTELKRRIGADVGRSVLVRTGKEDSAQESKDLSQVLSYLTIALLVFGLIALLVGAFVIFNTFTMTVAQRTREFGMLRTIGASRRQILQAVVLEALLIGFAGSVLGLFAGIGLAPLLAGLLGMIGFDLPSTALVIAARTIVVAILLGTVVTLLSSLAPALRATRISPMAAMREGAVGVSKVKRRWVRVLQSAVAGLGLVLMLAGLFAGLAMSSALTLLGIGAVLVFIGVGLMSPLLVGPLAALIGRPLAATGGVAARIARGNAVRSPGRTAGTAAALMIGVALVAFVAIFVNGFSASFSGAFEKTVTAQFVVFDPSGLTPEAVAPAAAKLRGRGRRGEHPRREGQAAVGRRRQPRRPRPEGRDQGREHRLGRGVRRHAARARAAGRDARGRLGAGAFAARRLVVRAAQPGARARAPDRPRNLRGPRPALRRRHRSGGDPARALRRADGARRIRRVRAPGPRRTRSAAQLTGLLDRDFPTLEPQTREEFIDAQVGQVNQILYVFYALLALSVIIALLGIVNTLALSVYERTREIGLLRAVGASRRQIRQIIRGEAIITAVMGAVLGVAIGVLFGVLISRPLGSQGFVLAIPYTTLVVLLVLGALAGVLAAVVPARRASRIDVLEALTHG